MKLDVATEVWVLEESVQRHRHVRDPYLIPNLADIFRVRVGDRVQLRFSFRGRDRHGPFLQSERHWLVVATIDGTSGTGILDSQPVCSDLLQIGDQIDFEHRHICSIERVGSYRAAETTVS